MTGRVEQSLTEMRKSKKGRKGKMPKNFSVKSGDKSDAGGLTAKGVKRYRAANPGSKLKTAVTTKPSKLKKGSKSAKRRKSFCARMGGMKKRLTSAKTRRDPDSRINKALRKWNCSTDIERGARVALAERIIEEYKITGTRSLADRRPRNRGGQGYATQTALDAGEREIQNRRARMKKMKAPGGRFGPVTASTEIFGDLIEACWKGYKAQGMKKKGNRMVPNCVKENEKSSTQIFGNLVEISVGRLKDYLATAKGLEKTAGKGSLSARRSNLIGRAEDRIRKASEEGSQQKKNAAGGEHGNKGSVRNVPAAGGGANFQTGTKIKPSKIPQGRISPEREEELEDAANRTIGKPTKTDIYSRSGATAALDAEDAGRGRTRNIPNAERRQKADAANLAIRKSRTPETRRRAQRALAAFRKRPSLDPSDSLARPFRR